MALFGSKQDAFLQQLLHARYALIHLDEQVGEGYVEFTVFHRATQQLHDHMRRVMADQVVILLDPRRNANISAFNFVPKTLVAGRNQQIQCDLLSLEYGADVDGFFKNIEDLLETETVDEFIRIYNVYNYSNFERELKIYIGEVTNCSMEYRNVLAEIRTWWASLNLTANVPRMKEFVFEYEINVSKICNTFEVLSTRVIHGLPFSALLTLCTGNSPVTGEFPAQRPVTRSFDVFFNLRLEWTVE